METRLELLQSADNERESARGLQNDTDNDGFMMRVATCMCVPPS
jgi:hypothetical protein